MDVFSGYHRTTVCHVSMLVPAAACSNTARARGKMWSPFTSLLLVLLLEAQKLSAKHIIDSNSNQTIVFKLLDVESVLPRGKDAGPFVLLHTLTGQCIQPKGQLIAGNDSTPGLYALELVLNSTNCDKESQSTQFMFTAAGHLQHVATGRCVAPAADIKDNPLAVLKDCRKQDANSSNWQWTLTMEASIQHRNSSKCLHPQGGKPNPGTVLHLHKGCGEERLEFLPTVPSKVASSERRKQMVFSAALEAGVGRKPSVAPAPLCCTAQECISRKATPRRNAFLTTARSSPYVAAAKGLACSLAKSNPGSHLIVMGGASDSERLSAEQLEYLKHQASIPGLTVEYRIVPDIDFPNYDNPRFHLNWIKLQAWNLTDWDAIIMLDADSVVVGDLKHLFRVPHHFASAPYQGLGKWNHNAGGFLFLRPSRAVFEHMLSLLLEYPSLQYRWKLSEQDFLRWYFQYDAISLPMQYHANAHQHGDLRSEGTVHGLKPIMLHFADRKPWEIPEDDGLYKYAHPCNSSFPVDHVLRRGQPAIHFRRRRRSAQGRALILG